MNEFCPTKTNGHSTASAGDYVATGARIRTSDSSDFMISGDMIGQMEASSESAVESSEASMLQPILVTVATQTDEYDNDDEDDAYYIDLQSSAADVPGIYEEPDISGEVFHPSGDLHLAAEMDLLDIGPDFDDDFGRTVDFEYKEVTIYRTNADQKIGLTLCYGSAADEITDIYVNEVDPLGIAGIDGRIREGDQILQINGFDVHTRQQAVRMFADSEATITLLLARPSLQLGNGSLNDHADEMPLPDGPPLCGFQGLRHNGLLLEENCEEFGLHSTYDDGIGEHADLPDHTSTRVSVLDEASGCIGLESKIAVLNEEMKRIRLQYEDFVTTTDLMRSPRLVPRMGTRLDQIRQLHYGASSDLAEPQRVRNEPLARTSRRHADEQPQQIKTSPKRSHQRRSASADKDAGAYNRCHGAASPSAMDRAREFDATHRTMVSKPSHSDLEQTTSGPYLDGAQKEWSSDGDGRVVNPANDPAQVHPEKNVESLQMLYNQYVEVMYTNKANLQHTIMVQQNLFQQQLARRNSARLKARAEQPPSPKSLSKHHTLDFAECAALPSSATSAAAGHHPNSVQPVSVATGSDIQMEWVVKRRADGSRYITRRPIRNRILKERARKLAEERCGLTTDDDAISELKIGRYWSKEERKRHLEKARDHRRQKEILLRQQMEGVKENYEAKREGSNVVELTYRKNVRQKGKKTCDDQPPLPVAESASQRSHETMHGKTYNLLSVTTV